MEDSACVATVVPIIREGWLVSEIPGRPLSVRLSRDVVLRLGIAVREGFGALRHRGLETGGLLIGTTKKDAAGATVVEIADFEPVECEHATGPSYLLSDVDRRLLASKIAAREAASKHAVIAGFYRSHTRRNFAITAEDAALFSTYFRKASDIFLLVKSNDDGPPTCGILIRKGGKELSGIPDVSFPLDRALFAALDRATPAPAPAPASRPVPAAAAAAVAVAPLPAVAAPPRRRKPLVAKWPAGAAIALGAAFAVTIFLGIPLRSRPGEPLALTVTNTGDNLRLSWNHRPRPATNGVLWIHDGRDEHRFELDSKQLREGSVSYWPRSNDVNFRLELTSAAGKVSESVRAVGEFLKPAIAAAPPAPAAIESPPAPPVGEPAIADANPLRSFRPSSTGSASRLRSRRFTAPIPERVPAAIAAATLPDPPAVPAADVPDLNRGKELLRTIAPANDASTHAGADSTLRVDVEPVARLVRNIPLIGRRSPRSDYVPPFPTSKATLLHLPHRDVDGPLKIDVKVYVNASGKVDYAELLSNVSKADSDLAALATFSARRWEFVPAREGREAVPGEIILHYQFTPPGARTAAR